MKYIMIYLIKLYQLIPGTFHQSCRHLPTCSEYAIIAFSRHGFFKGGYLSLRRILRCRKHGTQGIDLVPEKKEKKI